MAKADANGQTVTQVEAVLFEAAVIVKIRRKDLLKWPDDIEALHQYRISIRVARSLVKFLKPYLEREWCRELLDTLKMLQDPTSRMRELDVLVPTLDEGSEVRALCERAQRDTRAAFIAGLKADESKQAHELVQQGLRSPVWRRRARRGGIDADELAGRIEAQRRLCEDMLSTVDFGDQEAVHDLRKRAKALRYVSREMDAFLPEDAGQVSGRMREVQDKLGEWCDARVNAALLLEICGEQARDLADSFQAQARGIVQELATAQVQATPPAQAEDERSDGASCD